MKQSTLWVCRFGMAISLVFFVRHAAARDIQGPQVNIETKFVEVRDNFTKQVGIDWASLTKTEPIVPPTHFVPMGSAPTVDVNRIIHQIETAGEGKVLSTPRVNVTSGGPASFSGGGVHLDVTPTVNPNGSILVQVKPGVSELVPPGNTALFGRTVQDPSRGNHEVLMFITPRIFGHHDEEMPRGPQVEIPIETAGGTEGVSWGGPYAGIETGFTRTGSDFALKLAGRWHDMQEDEVHEIEHEAADEFDEDTGEIGGLMGYNWQYGHWVFGGEIEGRDYFDTCDSFESGDFFVGRTPFDVMSHFRTTYLVTAGPRIGYAVGRALPYVRAGVAFGELDAEQKLIVDDEFVQRGKFHEIQAGWTIATGLQYALTSKLSVRLEYQYTDLGTVNYASQPTDNGRHFGGWNSASLTEHSANVAFIYTFGSVSHVAPPPPPPPPP